MAGLKEGDASMPLNPIQTTQRVDHGLLRSCHVAVRLPTRHGPVTGRGGVRGRARPRRGWKGRGNARPRRGCGLGNTESTCMPGLRAGGGRASNGQGNPTLHEHRLPWECERGCGRATRWFPTLQSRHGKGRAPAAQGSQRPPSTIAPDAGVSPPVVVLHLVLPPKGLATWYCRGRDTSREGLATNGSRHLRVSPRATGHLSAHAVVVIVPPQVDVRFAPVAAAVALNDLCEVRLDRLGQVALKHG